MLGQKDKVMLAELEAQRIKVSKLENTIKELNQYDWFVFFSLLFGWFWASEMKEFLFN